MRERIQFGEHALIIGALGALGEGLPPQPVVGRLRSILQTDLIKRVGKGRSLGHRRVPPGASGTAWRPLMELRGLEANCQMMPRLFQSKKLPRRKIRSVHRLL